MGRAAWGAGFLGTLALYGAIWTSNVTFSEALFLSGILTLTVGFTVMLAKVANE